MDLALQLDNPLYKKANKVLEAIASYNDSQKAALYHGDPDFKELAQLLVKLENKVKKKGGVNKEEEENKREGENTTKKLPKKVKELVEKQTKKVNKIANFHAQLRESAIHNYENISREGSLVITNSSKNSAQVISFLVSQHGNEGLSSWRKTILYKKKLLGNSTLLNLSHYIELAKYWDSLFQWFQQEKKGGRISETWKDIIHSIEGESTENTQREIRSYRLLAKFVIA
jgi:hypothetical protein